MSFRSDPIDHAALRGPQGELVFVRLSVPQRSLEEALEQLAKATFPVNPEIRHCYPDSLIEFPAYDGDVEEIRRLLKAEGLEVIGLELASALSAILE